ncbi:MAG TPA: NAD-dependent epimerase/dehydratase family protein [Spirochaetota bacterium]|nr:NAD-dependent epimerase/dehydratase family protein [Spirochaetota bacterium]
MKITVIGGTGHIGTYLIPRLVQAKHKINVVCRGRQKPYFNNPAWEQVNFVNIDRSSSEAENKFGNQIKELESDVIIDLICFTPASCRQLVDAVRGKIQLLIHCGTIWVHGSSVTLPNREADPRFPLDDYGKNKDAIEKYLLRQTRQYNFPAAVFHPGHIVGNGWLPLNPAGNFNPVVYEIIAAGKELLLPHFGMETFHHVHADDLARIIMHMLAYQNNACGEAFHCTSPAALTASGYASLLYEYYNRQPRIKTVSWEDWKKQSWLTEQDINISWLHIARSNNCSMNKAQNLLHFTPRVDSIEAVTTSLTWLQEKGKLKL